MIVPLPYTAVHQTAGEFYLRQGFGGQGSGQEEGQGQAGHPAAAHHCHLQRPVRALPQTPPPDCPRHQLPSPRL